MAYDDSVSFPRNGICYVREGPEGVFLCTGKSHGAVLKSLWPLLSPDAFALPFPNTKPNDRNIFFGRDANQTLQLQRTLRPICINFEPYI
jgi:hypothetical protein